MKDENVHSWQPVKGDEPGLAEGPNVLLLPELPAGVVAIALEQFAPGTRIAQGSLSRARDATLDLLREAEFVVGFPWDMDEEAFRAARRSVRLVHLLSAGMSSWTCLWPPVLTYPSVGMAGAIPQQRRSTR
jgi:hypothetical protein